MAEVSLEMLGSAVAQLQTDVRGLKGDIQHARNMVMELNHDIVDLRGRIRGLEESMARVLEMQHAALDGQNKANMHLEAISARLALLEAR